MFRRKNAVYVQYTFEADELKLISIPHGTSATISYKVVYDSEENAKKFSTIKREAQVYPFALLSTPATQQAIFESVTKARLLAEKKKVEGKS
jgi:hypothetical protein